MKARYLYSELASLVQARRNCANANNNERMDALSEFGEAVASGSMTPKEAVAIVDKNTDRALALVKQHMPSGSGFDSGTTLDLDASHGEKLVFQTSFHHMDDGGYDGWTEHTVTVTPSFCGDFNIRISGRNRNDIKDYMHECFETALHTDVLYDLYIEYAPQFEVRVNTTFQCPFCHVQIDGSQGRPSHQCEQFPGDKSNPRRYQAMDEKQWYASGDQSFDSWDDARSYAGGQAYAQFMSRSHA